MRGGNQLSLEKTTSPGNSQRKHRGEAGDPASMATRMDIDNNAVEEDDDKTGEVAATSSIVIVEEDGFATLEIATGGDKIVTSFSSPSPTTSSPIAR